MKNEKYMEAPGLITQKRLRQSKTLRKLGYEWSIDYQVWASKTRYLLPALNNYQARSLADSINDLLK